MPRQLPGAVDTAAQAREGHAFYYLAELLFDSHVREHPSLAGQPDTLIEWGLVDPGTIDLLIMEASFDGQQWYDVREYAHSRGWTTVVNRTTGVVQTRIPLVEIGDALHNRSLRLRQTFLRAGVRLGYTLVEVTFDTIDPLTVEPHKVSRREESTVELALGSHVGTQASTYGGGIGGAVVAVRQEALGVQRSTESLVRITPGSNGRLWLSGGEVEIFTAASEKTYEIVQPGSAREKSMTVECWVMFTDPAPSDTEFILGWTARGLDGSDPTKAGTRMGFSIFRTIDNRIGAMLPQAVLGGVHVPNEREFTRGVVYAEPVVRTPAGTIKLEDRWYHVAVVYDGEVVTILVDGRTLTRNVIGAHGERIAGTAIDPVVVGAVNVRYNALAVETRGELIIGRPPALFQSSQPGIEILSHIGFDGLVDDLRVYDRAVPTSEIAQRMRRELSSAEVTALEADAGLKGYWKLQDSPTLTVQDATSGNSDGAWIEGASDKLYWARTGGWIGRLVDPNNDRDRHPYRISPAVSLGVFGNAIYATNAPFDIVWNGITWKGVGSFGGIVDAIEDTTTLEPVQITLALSGVVAAHISIALSQSYVDRPATLYGVFFDANGAMVSNPVELFAGKMDTMPVEIGETAQVGVTIESRLADWERPSLRRWNHNDQLARFPDDRGLDFIAQMADREIWWPARVPSAGPST